jgi:hypothetical protein
MSLLFTVIRAAIRTLFMRKQALLLENLAKEGDSYPAEWCLGNGGIC